VQKELKKIKKHKRISKLRKNTLSIATAMDESISIVLMQGWI